MKNDYGEKTRLNILYELSSIKAVEAVRLGVFNTINKIDCIRHRKLLADLAPKHDKATFRIEGAGVIGASLHHAIRIIRKSTDIKGKTILIIGCGRGAEINRWLKESPKKIVAIDYLDYSADWKKIMSRSPNVTIMQADIRKFDPGEKFDIIASKAVLEHINGLQETFPYIIKHLKEGGFFWADFGPLYYSWAGAHALPGYDHLLLSRKAFWKKAFAKKRDSEEEMDTLDFLKNDLFSRMKPNEYLAMFCKFLETCYLGIEISGDGLRFMRKEPEKYRTLRKKYSDRDLLVNGIFYLGKKTARPKSRIGHHK
jgi:SAM-dependent methyltransferase